MTANAQIVFFSKWLRSPLQVASVIPSSTRLARAMAESLPPGDGPVIELGGGTGPITFALLQAGIAPEQLIVVERDPHFHRHLKQRFPGVRAVLGDATRLADLFPGTDALRARAVVSGLPLLAMTAATQRKILEQSLALAAPGAPFIQFSYGLTSPLRSAVRIDLGLTSQCVTQVWRNLPPAKVWLYRIH